MSPGKRPQKMPSAPRQQIVTSTLLPPSSSCLVVCWLASILVSCLTMRGILGEQPSFLLASIAEDHLQPISLFGLDVALH
jgi:hypothetical protein